MVISLAVIVLFIVLFLVYFFIYNKAPIISGNFKYDIEYKANLKLDIYFPTHKVFKKAPVVVYFHGGAWVAGRKEVINANRVNGAVNRLREDGYTFVCPDYTLATQENSAFPDCIVDAFDVLNWIKENADEYNFDTGNIGVAGESAGAHIAMMIAYAQPQEIKEGLKVDVKINYVVDIYGPSNLETLYHSQTVEKLNERIEKLPENLRERLDIAQHLFGFDPEKETVRAKKVVEKYSPVNYLNRNNPPTLIIQGLSDQIVPKDQSASLYKKIDSLGVESEFYQLEDVGHAFRGISTEQKANVQDWIVDFIKAHYNP